MEKILVKCINCQNGGNAGKGLMSLSTPGKKYKTGTYICYCMQSKFWFEEVLNLTVECEHYKEIIEIE